MAKRNQNGKLLLNPVLITDDFSIYRRGFTQVPNVILRTKKLMPQAKLLYSLLLSYAWDKKYCWPVMDTLIEEMQLSRNIISGYLTGLKKLGLISVTRSNSVPSHNIYEIHVMHPTADGIVKIDEFFFMDEFPIEVDGYEIKKISQLVE